MHYQLFVPAAAADRQSSKHLLEQVGLADFVGNAESLPIGAGPDDGPGTLFAWRRPGANEPMGFRLHGKPQTWVPAIAVGGLAHGRYWVGYWDEAPPTPEDLARPYRYRGREVELGDGRHWLVPAVQQLPHDLILADDGSWKYEIQRQHHARWLEAEAWAARLKSGAGDVSDFAAASYVLDALRLNYRLLPEVASRLRLLNSENLAPAFLAILGSLAI